MTTITPRSRARRAGAVISALALSGLVLGGLVAPASAITIGEVGNIDAAHDGASSIVITKYEKSSSNGTTAGNGTPATVTGTTIDGVTFSLHEVVTTAGNASLDLLTGAGWAAAAAIEDVWSASAPTTLPAGYSLVSHGTQTTAGGGVATFGTLGFGLYLVQETTPLAEGIVDPAQPFLVTLPFPTGSLVGNTNEWLYTVNVYPKNAVTGVEKEVITSDAAFRTEASHVTWTITADVPQLPTGDNFTQFRLVDTINPAELEFVATTATLPTDVTGFGVRAYAAGGTTALAGLTTAMYAIDESAAATGTLALQFTADGYVFLRDNAQGGRVEFDVPTVVLTPGNAAVVNDVTSYVNASTLEADAEQEFGALRVFKYAETTGVEAPASTQTPLVGATFELYHDANADGVADAGELVTIDGAVEWTVTDVSGILTISGIKPGDYLLLETEAPVGYQLAADVADRTHAVTIAAGAADAATGKNYLEVENEQVPEWMLPFTGGNGVLTFTLVGAGLMALALGFAFIAMRRRTQATQA